MKKNCKKITLSLIFIFAFPVITAACCCAESPIEKGAENLTHQHLNSKHEHDSDHDHQSGSSHDHGLCNHGPIIGNLVNQTSFVFPVDAFGKFFHYNLFFQEENKLDSILSRFPSSDHGPPGSNLAATPLYLKISALRI